MSQRRKISIERPVEVELMFLTHELLVEELPAAWRLIATSCSTRLVSMLGWLRKLKEPLPRDQEINAITYELNPPLWISGVTPRTSLVFEGYIRYLVLMKGCTGRSQFQRGVWSNTVNIRITAPYSVWNSFIGRFKACYLKRYRFEGLCLEWGLFGMGF